MAEEEGGKGVDRGHHGMERKRGRRRTLPASIEIYAIEEWNVDKLHTILNSRFAPAFLSFLALYRLDGPLICPKGLGH